MNFKRMDLTRSSMMVLMLCFSIHVHFFGIASGTTLRRLNGKVELLQTMLELETEQRHSDYENIVSKLDEITTKLDKMEIKANNEGAEVDKDEQNVNIGGKSDDHVKDQLLILIKGMKDEKRFNREFRRSLQHDLTEMNHRVRREVLRLDSRINASHLMSNENVEKIYQNFEALRKEFGSFAKQNDDRYKTFSRAFEDLTKIQNDKFEKLGHDLENLNKQCNLDDVKYFTGTSIEQLCSNMSHSSEKSKHSTVPYSSCEDLKSKGYKTSGVYKIRNDISSAEFDSPIQVYCDQTTDGGGWTVFQRRMNGEVDFYRDWADYKMGFGNQSGEFWLGNMYISALLEHGNHELRIDIEDFGGNRKYAKYSSFSVDSEKNKYTLHIDGYSGSAGDSLKYHNNNQFTTKDYDTKNQCAKLFKGAWWYGECYYSNLNGKYHFDPIDPDHDGIIWSGMHRNSLKHVEMKFRPV